MKIKGYTTVIVNSKEELEKEIEGKRLWQSSDGRTVFNVDGGGFAAFVKEAGPEEPAR